MTGTQLAAHGSEAGVLPVTHVVKGRIVEGTDIEYLDSTGVRFATPKIDLDELAWPRSEQGPAFDVPLDEILQLLGATAEAMRHDASGHLQRSIDQLALMSPLSPEVLERDHAQLWRFFDPDRARAELRAELGDERLVDDWCAIASHDGRYAQVREFPPRIIKILAGNAPAVGPRAIVLCALVKGVMLMKLPSNDLFTTSAALRTMIDIAPEHPVIRSISAVYWRGGDERIESTLFRPQFFDKVVAYGGESAIRNVVKYLGPGFELVAFDPKTSISMIGREAFESPDLMRKVAAQAAADATIYNQEACTAARYQFVEGDEEVVDAFCDALLEQLGVERATTSPNGQPPPKDLVEQIEALRGLDPFYRVWGKADGRGMVVRSDEPVDFHPTGRIVNVVRVASLDEAVKFANVATQTVGIYPHERSTELRDALAAAGVQRIVPLGNVCGPLPPGIPHDGFFPLHRFVRWISDGA